MRRMHDGSARVQEPPRPIRRATTQSATTSLPSSISNRRAEPRPGTGTVLGMATGTPMSTLPVIIADRSDHERRQRLAGRVRRLTQVGLAWHALEAAIAIAAGIVAGSVALVGFGADSVIEAVAGLAVLWLVTGERLSSHHAERRAQQLIAASFLAL